MVLQAFSAGLKFVMSVENYGFMRKAGFHPSDFHCLKSFLSVSCWNVRSLVEVDGGVKTAIVQPGKHPVAVDRKLSFYSMK